MTQAILFHYLRHDRGGILPVNTFKFAEGPVKVDEVSRHLSNMLDALFTQPLPQSYFWVDTAGTFDQDEQESYGNVYSQLDRDDQVKLPSDTYGAARALLAYILDSDIWLDFADSVYPIQLSGATLSDIPAKLQVVELVAPTEDPRFTIGETVTANGNVTFTYRGVYFQPNDTNPNGSYKFVDQRCGVFIGVENNSFVTQRMTDEFLTANTVEVHPLPRAISRSWYNGVEKPKWFARSKDKKYKNVEAFGKTQATAKRAFAAQALLG